MGGLYPTPVNRGAALVDSGFREITSWESDLERRPGGGGVRSRGWVWPKRIVYNIKKPQVTCRKYVSKRKGDVLLFYAFVHFYFDIYTYIYLLNLLISNFKFKKRLMAFSVELSYTSILKRDPAEGRLYNFIMMKSMVWFYGISNLDFLCCIFKQVMCFLSLKCIQLSNIHLLMLMSFSVASNLIYSRHISSEQGIKGHWKARGNRRLLTVGSMGVVCVWERAGDICRGNNVSSEKHAELDDVRSLYSFEFFLNCVFLHCLSFQTEFRIRTKTPWKLIFIALCAYMSRPMCSSHWQESVSVSRQGH